MPSANHGGENENYIVPPDQTLKVTDPLPWLPVQNRLAPKIHRHPGYELQSHYFLGALHPNDLELNQAAHAYFT